MIAPPSIIVPSGMLEKSSAAAVSSAAVLSSASVVVESEDVVVSVDATLVELEVVPVVSSEASPPPHAIDNNSNTMRVSDATLFLPLSTGSSYPVW